MKTLSKTQIGSILVFSYLSAISIFMELGIPSTVTDNNKLSVISEMLWNVKYSLKNTSVQSTLLFVLLAAAAVFIEKRREKGLKAIPIVSFLISCVWLMSKSYMIDDTTNALFSTAGQTVKCIIYLAGTTWMISMAFYLLGYLTENVLKPEQKADGLKKQSEIAKLYKKHPMLTAAVGLILCWTPHIILAYPGYITTDAWTSILQYNHLRGFTSHHPPVFTVLVSVFMNIGIKLGGSNAGIFILVAIQIVACAAVLAYMIYIMNTVFNSPKWLNIGAFLIGALVPYYSGYVTVVVKDNPYSYAFLLFMIECVCLLEMGTGFFKSKKHIVLLAVSIIMVNLFRNNGKYVIVPFLMVILVCMLFKRKSLPAKKQKAEAAKQIVQVAAVFLIPLIASMAVEAAVISHYNISGGSKREMFSLLFQQTARYVKYHESEMSDEEKSAIAAILDYDNIKEDYDPRISDPVKNKFKENVEVEDFKNYLKVWLLEFFKHPKTYVDATLNQNYCILYPGVDNDKVYEHRYHTQFDLVTQIEAFADVEKDEPSARVEIDKGIESVPFSLPVLGMLSNGAFYNMLYIGLFIFAAYRKNGKWLLASIPIILCDAIVVLGPVVLRSPRYTFPIVYPAPILLAFYIYTVNGCKPAKSAKNNKKKKKAK